MGNILHCFVQKKEVCNELCPDYSECKEFNFQFDEPVWVIKVYDGDTYTIAKKIDEVWYKFQVRVNGIDCPEIKTKNLSEHYVAEKAKTFVSELILRKKIYVKNIQKDKYGRLLSDVYTINNEKISDLLIKKHLAVAYDGGTKKSPDDWKQYFELIVL